MTQPYELYIRFLATKGIEEVDEVNEQLKELSLPTVRPEYFDKIYTFVHDSVPQPTSNQILSKRYDGDFLKWMKVIDVQELWLFEKKYRTQESTYIRLAYDIHTDPKVRHTVNALMLNNESLGDICQSVNNKYSYMLKPEHLKIYNKFFWNPAIMTRKAWKEYIRSCDNYEKSLLFLFLE